MSGPRHPEPWQTSAPGPFLSIEAPRGLVPLHRLGDDRFRLTGLGEELEITGFAAARDAAHGLGENAATQGN
jgi:hypothetical protein